MSSFVGGKLNLKGVDLGVTKKKKKKKKSEDLALAVEDSKPVPPVPKAVPGLDGVKVVKVQQPTYVGMLLMFGIHFAGSMVLQQVLEIGVYVLVHEVNLYKKPAH